MLAWLQRVGQRQVLNTASAALSHSEGSMLVKVAVPKPRALVSAR